MLTQEQQIFEQINKASNILITFKKTWNGDAVASALAMYLLIKMVNQLEKEIEVRTAKDKSKKLDILDQKKCPFCYSIISYKATRCPQCTSQLKPPSKNNA